MTVSRRTRAKRALVMTPLGLAAGADDVSPARVETARGIGIGVLDVGARPGDDEARIYDRLEPKTVFADVDLNAEASREAARGTSRETNRETGYDRVMRAHEHILEGLRRDRIQALFLRDLDGDPGDPDARIAAALGRGFKGERKAAYRALEELRATGDLIAFGAGFTDPETGLRLIRNADIDLLRLDHADTFAIDDAALDGECAARGVGLVFGPQAPAVTEIEAEIEALCRDYETTAREASIALAFARRAAWTVMTDERDPGALVALSERLGAPSPPELWEALKARGLMAEGAATPAEEETT